MNTKPAPDKSENYIAFMLRGWRENDQDEVTWRFSLEDPHTGQRQGFTDLPSLLRFVQDKLGDHDRLQG